MGTSDPVTMNALKKTLILALLLISVQHFVFTDKLNGVEYVIDSGGEGYDEMIRVSSLAPAIGLGVLALAAIIAVAIPNISGHAHAHD